MSPGVTAPKAFAIPTARPRERAAALVLPGSGAATGLGLCSQKETIKKSHQKQANKRTTCIYLMEMSCFSDAFHDFPWPLVVRTSAVF